MNSKNLKIKKRSINFWIHALAGSLSKGAMRYYGLRFNIRLPEMRILNTLYDDGDLAARDLVYLTAMDKGLVSRILSGLSTSGYIKQIGSDNRVRMRRWTLTKEGKRMVEKLEPEWTKRWQFILADFTVREREKLKVILEKLFVASEALCQLEEKESKKIRRLRSLRRPTVRPQRSTVPDRLSAD